jgi:alkanesulfonate monooxygenase SsuD/methylene tetrahydromethanopterin reductase-like flavin-dependent oxidoreductase (luciferase family)
MVQNRLGMATRLMPVEDALAHRWTEDERAAAARYVDTRADVVGGPERVRAGLEAAVEASGADEVIVISNTCDPRRAALTRLAEVMWHEPQGPSRTC